MNSSHLWASQFWSDATALKTSSSRSRLHAIRTSGSTYAARRALTHLVELEAFALLALVQRTSAGVAALEAAAHKQNPHAVAFTALMRTGWKACYASICNSLLAEHAWDTADVYELVGPAIEWCGTHVLAERPADIGRLCDVVSGMLGPLCDLVRKAPRADAAGTPAAGLIKALRKSHRLWRRPTSS